MRESTHSVTDTEVTNTLIASEFISLINIWPLPYQYSQLPFIARCAMHSNKNWTHLSFVSKERAKFFDLMFDKNAPTSLLENITSCSKKRVPMDCFHIYRMLSWVQ